MSRDKENLTLAHESKMLREILDETKKQGGTFKEDQQQLIENLRLQLNETREMINKMRENKEKEFKKTKERYDDERRRESEQYQMEYEKLKNEIGLMQRKLGQEEHYNKELAVLNNKLQNNLTTVKGNNKDVHELREYSTIQHRHFYPKSDYEDESEGDDIIERKRAWAELDREQQEVKRNIKSLMRMAPESRVLDDPMLADRVRNVRYEPKQYNHEEEIMGDKKYSKLKEEVKREEKAAAKQSEPKPQSVQK